LDGFKNLYAGKLLRDEMKKYPTTTVALFILQIIPLSVRKFLFTNLALLVYYLLPRRRRVAVDNLRRAFPEKSVAEIFRIVKGVYRNFGILAAEFVDIPRLNVNRVNSLMEIKGMENYEKARAKNRGVILMTAHFGNWELLATAFAIISEPITVLYRTLDNPLLDNLVYWVRASTGNTLMHANHAMRSILRSLRDKRNVGLLIDQNWSRQEGCFVEFFNRPACTSSGLAFLALHKDVPILPAYLIRKDDGKYIMQIGAEFETVKSGDDEHDIVTNTQRYTKDTEEIVRRYPEQWFWVHKRWKTQPLPLRNENRD